MVKQNDKVAKFMMLAGQSCSEKFRPGTAAERELGAQLLLSEVLEYIIDGLGVLPELNGQAITDPEGLKYCSTNEPNQIAALDGLADTFYTMWWNAHAFGIPLAAASELVCDNNLEKFVKLGSWAAGKTELPAEEWDCRQKVVWPPEVARVFVVEFEKEFYAVGKDARGKVRKPSTYRSVDLKTLLSD